MNMQIVIYIHVLPARRHRLLGRFHPISRGASSAGTYYTYIYIYIVIWQITRQLYHMNIQIVIYMHVLPARRRKPPGPFPSGITGCQ